MIYNEDIKNIFKLINKSLKDDLKIYKIYKYILI